MASHSHDQDGDDDDTDFEEYNPHPYRGGYDIVQTYGRPLPPSAATCYPVDSGHRPPQPTPPPSPPPVESGHRPPQPTPPVESAHRPPQPTPPPSPPPVESDHRIPSPPQPDHGPVPPFDYGYRPDPDVYGFWPFVSERWGRGCQLADVEEVGFWSQWKRAGDYLFGYSQGLGERRIGVDSYGIPIYADKRQASEALTVQIEAARDLKVDWHESDSWDSSYEEKKIESYGYAYNKYQCQEPLYIEENWSEPMLRQTLAYHEVYEEQGWPSSDEEKKIVSYGYAYNKYQCQEPLLIEENRSEPMSHQTLAYHKVYEEQVVPNMEGHASSWQYPDESNFYANHEYAQERKCNEHALGVELEPYKSTWSQDLNYQEFYGRLSPGFNYHSLPESGEGNQRYGEPSDAYGNQHYEQPQCVELEPFKPSWAQNPIFYESCMREISQSSWDENSFNGYGGFNGFLEHSPYYE